MPADQYTFSTRHLAPSEVIADVLNKYGSGSLLHAAILRSEVPVTKALLTRSLELLSDRQPVLKMRIATEVGRKGRLIKRFMQMDTVVPDVQVFHGQDRTSWISLAETGLQTPLDASRGPLWKMIFVVFDDAEEPSGRTSRGSVAEVKMWRRASKYSQQSFASRSCPFTGAILFKAHQAIADCFSMLDLLHNQLMPIMTLVHNEGDLSIFHNPVSMSPAADDAFVRGEKLPWGERRRIRQQRGKWKKGDREKEESREQPPETPKDVTPYVNPLFETVDAAGDAAEDSDSSSGQTQLIPFPLSNLTSERLLMDSQKNNVSVQEVMLAAAVMALGLTNGYAHRRNPDVVCSYPVDLRMIQHAETGQDQPLGLWVGSIIQKFRPLGTLPDLDQFWQEVRKVSSLLDKDCRPWDLLCVYKEIAKSPREDRIVKLNHTYTKAQLEVSALRTQDLVVSQAKRQSMALQSPVTFAMDEHYYVKPLNDVSSVPMSLTVTVLERKVMWTLAYNSKCISRQFAVRFLDTLHLLLKNAMHPTTVQDNGMKRLPSIVRAKMT